ncbi:MAG: terminase family protein [Paludibacteraceae bacterium]|nr:terminase family protein [Paludibacteraceae bacterium]
MSGDSQKIIKYAGFKPFLHQRAVIDEIKEARGTGKNVVCVSSRQKGKTTMIANILLYYAINFSSTKNYCVSPTLRQAKEVYKTIIRAIGLSGIVRSSNGTDLIINLINGSEIKFVSAEMGDALRGYSCNGITCIDECAYIQDNVFNLINPWTDFHRAPKLLVSTPFVKSGFFYDYYNYGLEHTHNTVSINWSDPIFKEDIEKIMPPERLEEYKAVLPRNVFKTEYLGEWLDDDGTVFINFRNCIKDVRIQPDDRLFVGIDFSNQTNNDDTAISILNQFGEQVMIKYFNNLTPLGQIDELYKIISPFERQIVSLQFERNSIGEVYGDLLTERLQTSTRNKVFDFTTTNQSKADIVTKLQVGFEQENIRILNDEKQLRELEYFSADYNPKTKVVTYNAPQGLHDDICMALMLSYDAYKKSGIRGNYLISMTRTGMRKW